MAEISLGTCDCRLIPLQRRCDLSSMRILAAVPVAAGAITLLAIGGLAYFMVAVTVIGMMQAYEAHNARMLEGEIKEKWALPSTTDEQYKACLQFLQGKLGVAIRRPSLSASLVKT